MPGTTSCFTRNSRTKKSWITSRDFSVSEISRPDALAAGAALYADGRIMNNALAYPGLFRGALEAGAKIFTLEMLIAAAEALVDLVPPGQLLPEMMDPATHEAVAAATVHAAAKSGTAINR